MPALRIPSEYDVRQIPADRILSQVSWVTESLRASARERSGPAQAERAKVARSIETYQLFYTNAVRFLQEHGMTTGEILAPGETAVAATAIRAGDLTDEGLRFYYYGIRAWMNLLDRARWKQRVATDHRFLERKLTAFRRELARE